MVGNASQHDPAAHDAQRDLEQRALRNVRGLVDRIEADAASERRTRRWIVGILAAALVVLAAVVAVMVSRTPSGGEEIAVRPVPAPAAR